MPWINNKNYAVVMMLLLSAIMLFCGCSNEEKSQDPGEHTEEEIILQSEITGEVRAAAEAAGMSIFSFEEPGYFIFYPDDWNYDYSGNVVTFRDSDSTDDNYAEVRMQRMLSHTAGGVYTDLESVFESYKLQFGGAGRHIIEKEEMFFEQEGLEFPVIHFLAEYSRDGELFRQWTAILRRDERYFLQFSYTAPAEFFDQYKHISGDMWLSLTLTDY